MRRKSSHPLAGALVAAAIATFIGLNFLRAGLGSTHIFQFSKDDLVLVPVITIALARLVEALDVSRRARFVAGLIVIGWIGWGMIRLSADIRGRFIRPDYPPASTVGATSGSRGA
jgi:hypothetical protein